MIWGYNGNLEEGDDLLGTGMSGRCLLGTGKLDPFDYCLQGKSGLEIDPKLCKIREGGTVKSQAKAKRKEIQMGP